MITGFNTDVPHGGLVFHVQTEDNGVANPLIESIVYVGGRVVSSKRSSYRHLLDEGKGKPEIAALMERQHRVMIEAIRRGRYDELMGIDNSTGPATAKVETEGDAEGGELPASSPTAGVQAPAPAPAPVAAPTPSVSEVPPASPASTEVPASAQAAAAHHETTIAAPPTVTVAPPPSATPTLDEVILDYLSAEAEQEQLVLTVDTVGELALGGRVRMFLAATSSKTERPVPGAHVKVDLISTVTEPITLIEKDTDLDGNLDLELSIPDLPSGTSALIIRAGSAIGDAEIKQLF